MKKFNAVGCNIFAGGFTLGMQRHVNVLCHLEHGTKSHSQAAKCWMPDLPIYDDKSEWPILELLADGVDILFANPPCAIWSPCGITLTKGADYWRQDPRVERWHDALTAGITLKARCIAIESVPRAVSPTGGRPLMLDFTRQCLTKGYGVTWLMTDAVHCGVPQRRQRFFFVAHKQDFSPVCDWLSPITPEEALSGVEPVDVDALPDSVRKYIHQVAPGEGLRRYFDKHSRSMKKNSTGAVIGRPRFMDHRLAPDALCGTITSDCLYHWKDPRRLSAQEYAALCGYPLPLPFPKSWSVGKQVQMLVQAVMPPVGAWIGRELHRSLQRPCLNTVTRPHCFRVIDLREYPGKECVLSLDVHQEALSSMSLREIVKRIAEDYES